MGGKAFPEFKCVRLNKNGFMVVATACLDRLQEKFPRHQFKVVESFRNKDSFGDLDILWCGETIQLEEMTKTLKAAAYKPNGPVTSFALHLGEGMLFQVDMIYTGCEHMESAASYFAFNDLGNLLGRIFHRAGFKLGHKGLLYVVREEGNQSHALEEIEVTRSWQEALEFAGYDFERWTQGFDELEDVFRFAVSIPLANRTIFRLDETNHQARVRDRKRLTYQTFLRWVNDPANGIPENELIPKDQLRKEWLERAFETFPDFKERFDQANDKMLSIREANEKFNGNLVRELTGLDGKELGEFMRSFINEVIGERLGMSNKGERRVQWVQEHTPEQIKQAIQEWAKR